jgi:hypothetical protein
MQVFSGIFVCKYTEEITPLSHWISEPSQSALRAASSPKGRALGKTLIFLAFLGVDGKTFPVVKASPSGRGAERSEAERVFGFDRGDSNLTARSVR